MSDQAEAAPKQTTLQALAVFLERRTLVMIVLGFAAGLPNLLIFDTLSLWLREAGLSLEVIAFFSLATLAYSLKFLWAPLVDRTRVPLLTSWLGHRRSWMLVCQGLIMVGLWLVAGGDPARNLGMMALFAVFVGFSSATQDIVIDAWRIEAADQDRQGPMATAYQWGYRVAIILAGVVPLALAELYSWRISYAVMAAMMLIGVAAVLAAPREQQHTVRPIHADGTPARPALEPPELLLRLVLAVLGSIVLGSGLAGKADLLVSMLGLIGAQDAGAALTGAFTASGTGVFVQLGAIFVGFLIIFMAVRPFPGFRTRPGVFLERALGDPLRDFFGRYGATAALILAAICLYRISDFVLNVMNPFYADLGFTRIQIAEIRKVFGVIASIVGVSLGGFTVVRLGLMRALVIGAFAGPLSNLVFAWLATQGPELSALTIAIGVDNVAAGFAGTCLIAYMSSLTGHGFTATQYALFSSLYALPGKIIASQSGRIVEGAARAADAGGPLGGLKAMLTGLPPEAYATSMERSQVSAAGLAAGYIVFFIYSTVIGLIGIVLAFMVAGRPPPAPEEPVSATAEPEPDQARQTT